MFNRLRPTIFGLTLVILATAASPIARKGYSFDAWPNIWGDRTPYDNSVGITALLYWDEGSCYDGPMYPLVLEVSGSDGYYGWDEAYWTETQLYETFHDYGLPTGPDDIDYTVYSSVFDCGQASWQYDQIGPISVQAEDPYPNGIDWINTVADDPCDINDCTGYGFDYTIRVMSQWPGVAIPNIHIDEFVDIMENECNDSFTAGGFEANGNGDFVDYVWRCCSGNHLCCQGGPCALEVDRDWRHGGLPVSYSTVFYSCTDYYITWW